MEIDPFFKLNQAITTEKHTFESKVGLIGFFLCSFDITNGLQILYSFPPNMKKNQDEINILKTHCIWKIERIPLRIDLKFSEFIYSAFQFHDPSQDEVLASTENPLYGIVLKIWKDNNFINTTSLMEFKSTLEEKSSDLELLYKCKILASNPIKRGEFRELSKKTGQIKHVLEDIWFDFCKRQTELKDSFELVTQLTTDFSPLPTESAQCATGLFKKKISMRTLPSEENPDKITVILANRIENLNDVQIHVSQNSEFFSESIWEQKIGEWPVKEDLILEFPKSETIQHYLIKISSRGTTVAIKSLEIGLAIT
ncbi:MAG: hypothetical protein ACXAC8_10340 [Candidatus Hodarchaeales archaeon]|jgi:hypothetical protein